jgi:hypothetical protein
MVTGAIAYRTLEGESPRTVSVIQTLLEKHPWDADRWRDNVEKLPESQRGEMLFMLAARWADDIRPQAKLQREVRWHYINFPFKPTGEPEEIKPLLPDRDNILVGRLSKIATGLLSKFSRVGLRELDQRLPEAWAKESYEVAVKIAYENENLREPRRTGSGLPRGTGRELRIPWVSGES